MFANRRYTALPILIVLFRLAAAVPLLLGVFALLNGALQGIQAKPPLEVAIALGVSIVPLLFGLGLLAFAELLQVAIDIEANTRRAAEEDLVDAHLARARREAELAPGI